MRRFLAVALLCGMLVSCLAGVVSASSTDAKVKDIYWNVGTEGYTPVPYTRGMYTEYFTIPGSTTLAYTAPLTVPSKISGKNCTVNRIYLYWAAPSGFTLQEVDIATGGYLMGTWPVGESGTGADHLITVDLGGSYAVPRGLVMAFDIANSGSADECYIKGYGAMIKHAA